MAKSFRWTFQKSVWPMQEIMTPCSLQSSGKSSLNCSWAALESITIDGWNVFDALWKWALSCGIFGKFLIRQVPPSFLRPHLGGFFPLCLWKAGFLVRAPKYRHLGNTALSRSPIIYSTVSGMSSIAFGMIWVGITGLVWGRTGLSLLCLNFSICSFM